MQSGEALTTPSHLLPAGPLSLCQLKLGEKGLDGCMRLLTIIRKMLRKGMTPGVLVSLLQRNRTSRLDIHRW